MNSETWIPMVLTGPVWLMGLIRGDSAAVWSSVAVIATAGLLMARLIRSTKLLHRKQTHDQ
jgi:hypothetical protein